MCRLVPPVSIFILIELSRLLIDKSMSFVIQVDCFGRLMRFVTCGKCVLIMFEKVHRNVSKHSSVVWLVVFIFVCGMVCRSAIEASGLNVL